MPDVLHEDDPDAELRYADGSVVRNLTAEEYAATYAEGTTHGVPAEALQRVLAELDEGDG